ncbi:MAG: vitamin K epoxide reductase family protein, partial [Myxococcota bacterium]
AQWGTVAGAAVALGANAYLVWLKVDKANAPEVCGVSEVINCESIFDSPFAQVFAGNTFETPITVLGAAFFAGLLVAAVAFGANNARFYRISLAFAAVNVLLSLMLGGVLLVGGHVCPFCFTIYLANLVVLGAAIKGVFATGEGLFDNLGDIMSGPDLWALSAVFVGLVVGAHATGLAGNPAEVDDVAVVKKGGTVDLSKYYTLAVNPVDLDGSEPKKGAEDPTYVVVEFADYLCGHCAHASEEMGSWLPLQDDVQLIFKVYPLSFDCNPHMPESRTGPYPCLAALYAECSGQQGLFWDVNHDLYANQEYLMAQGYNVNALNALVQARGVNPELVATCIEDRDVQRGVVMDANAGGQLRLEGTPSFFVKGVTDDGTWVQTKNGLDDVKRLIAADRQVKASRREADDSSGAGSPEPAGP